MILLITVLLVWMTAAVVTALAIGRTVRRADREESAPNIPWDARSLESVSDR